MIPKNSSPSLEAMSSCSCSTRTLRELWLKHAVLQKFTPNETSLQLVCWGSPQEESAQQQAQPRESGRIHHAFKYLYFKCTAGSFAHSWHGATFSRLYLSIHISMGSDKNNKDSPLSSYLPPPPCLWKLISNQRFLLTVHAADLKVPWPT